MGYTKQTLKGFSRVWLLRLATRSLSFLRIAIIARVLTPELFGLYGIAALILSFVEILTESGINILIIQEKEDLNKIVSTAWVVSVIRGFLIAVIIGLSAPVISVFFNAPNAASIVMLIGAVPLIRGFINPSIIKFQKDLDFKGEFFFRGLIFTIESVSAILFVILTKDPSGIVYGLVIGALIELVLSFVLIKPVPRFEVKSYLIRKIISRGKWLTAGGIFNYLFHNADDAVVGKVLGTASLGVYDMAYKLSMLPITEIGETVSRVIFPVYTNIAEDKLRLKRAFYKTIAGISIFIIPVGIFFLFFAEPLVLIVLGEKWIAAAPVVRALAVFSVIRTYLRPIFSVFLAVKKQEYNTVVMFVGFVAMILSIFPLINCYGLVGAAYAAVLGMLISLPFALYFVKEIFA